MASRAGGGPVFARSLTEQCLRHLCARVAYNFLQHLRVFSPTGSAHFPPSSSDQGKSRPPHFPKRFYYNFEYQRRFYYDVEKVRLSNASTYLGVTYNSRFHFLSLLHKQFRDQKRCDIQFLSTTRIQNKNSLVMVTRPLLGSCLVSYYYESN